VFRQPNPKGKGAQAARLRVQKANNARTSRPRSECGDPSTRRHEIFLSSQIFPKSHKQNLFTAGAFGMKRL
jgi:hypothetical protein